MVCVEEIFGYSNVDFVLIDKQMYSESQRQQLENIIQKYFDGC